MLARLKQIVNAFNQSHHSLCTLSKAKTNKGRRNLNVLITQRVSLTEAPPARSRNGCLAESRQSKIGTFRVAVLVGLLFGGSFTLEYLFGAFDSLAAQLVSYFDPRASHQSGPWPKNPNGVVEPPLVMPVPTLPGRPGNLSQEQEAKLQEFWLATLRVFGVHSDHDGDKVVESNGVINPSSTMGGGQRQVMADAGNDKKRKSRLGLFGRKNQKEADESSTENRASAISSTPQLADGDDKYGQAKEFRHAIASQSPGDLRNAFWSMVKHDHPDGLLLRFLRARKWDVEKALIMLISTMHWRSQEMHVDDDVIKRGEGGALESAKHASAGLEKDGDDFLVQLRMGKSFLHGVDKEGRPMCFVRVRLHRQGEQSEASLERYTVYVIETARLFLTPSVDTAAIVFDMTGFSMANMDYAPLKFMIKCFEANYPESLGIVIVHKSPWIFQGLLDSSYGARGSTLTDLGIWSIIKGWLDPVVASKVHFTKNVEELDHYVPRSHIPKELGGEEDWAYQYVEPTASENERMADRDRKDSLLQEREALFREFETATLAWIGESVASDEFRGLQNRRDNIAGNLRANYWRVDPYIRARTLYDRLGIISDDGQIEPYPKVKRVGNQKQLDSVQPIKTSVDDLD
ncbi:MAG: hypothetical protein M1812_000876 [Candelaria pacifica]|nr:MAG: hypothetical protein M1812_000876 [Candelaria pacifica]